MNLVKRLLGLVRKPAVKWLFLAVAVGLAVYAVWSTWDDLVDAAGRLSVATLAGSAVLTVAYVLCTLVAWRAVLADLGSPLPGRAAVAVFGVSQIGKYVPGGVWNVVAAAELGATHRIPRRRSLAAMAVAVLVSVVSGAVVGTVCLPFVSSGTLGGWTWAAVAAAVLLAVLLLPPVLTRVIGLAFRLARREPLEKPLSWRGLGATALWSVIGWLFAGAQVWVLATGLGLDATPRTFALAVGGYALAWVVGFLIILVPAGAGAREGVLLAVMGAAMPHAELLLVALLSRVLMTLVDLGLAGIGGALARGSRRAVPAAEPRSSQP
ncbi:lysylphosphatidylglycerol synthase domain-containing protein [Puerhibacterium sp. TATVAM-FAB25]|uniref:lysylphosphatidylglycerol synthase domain-containing protein n=1 Tax=Puerhibacterium sp. TATVAM-FAB25 TaxID=3093699 RepID=UPI00397BF9D0